MKKGEITWQMIAIVILIALLLIMLVYVVGPAAKSMFASWGKVDGAVQGTALG